MINSLHGIVKECKEQLVIISMGPIGFDVHVASSTQFNKGDTVELCTHLHWNQEQGPTMYGFQTETDKQVFQLVISCSGLGPKIGLAVLDQLGATSFLQAIQMDDEKRLSKVTGIGAKKAEQMIVQLRHKVKKLFAKGIQLDSSAVQSGQHWNDVIDALESLNYSRHEVNNAMKQLSEEKNEQTLNFEQLMRKALSLLSKRP